MVNDHLGVNDRRGDRIYGNSFFARSEAYHGLNHGARPCSRRNEGDHPARLAAPEEILMTLRSPGPHAGKNCPGQKEGRLQIDRQGPVPIFLRQLVKGFLNGDAGVVYQDTDRPETVLNFPTILSTSLLWETSACAKMACFPICSTRERVSFGLIFPDEEIDGDIRPCRGKGQRAGPADPPAGSRNKGYFPIKGFHFFSFIAELGGCFPSRYQVRRTDR